MPMNMNAKRIMNIAFKAVSWLVVAFAVFMMIFTIFTVTTVNRNERSIFGFRFYIVRTDSMSLSEKNAEMDVHFDAGDIIIVKNMKETAKWQLKEGDIISFLSTNTETYGETVTHMIREVKKDGSGKVLGYVTFGTNTGSNDEALVEPSYVLGTYAGRLPAMGHFFAFVKSVPGYVVCILVPFLVLILYHGINTVRLFRRYKREQMETMQAERDQIEAERAENQRLLQERMELKAQLAAEDPASGDAPAEESKTDENQ